MTLEIRSGTAPHGDEVPRGDGGTAAPGARVLVAGVGNMFLRDDGFGPEVARRLAVDSGHAVPGMFAVDYGIRGLHLAYDLLAGVDVLVLVDTVPAGAARPADIRAGDGAGGVPRDGGEGADGAAADVPGSIRVLRVRPEDLDGPSALEPHGMDPVAVLGRLRSLGGELPVTYVVGCVPADLAEGIGLSAAVAAAVPQAIAAVVGLASKHNLAPALDLVPDPDREGPRCA